jgi:hypothetical protein
MRFMAPKKLLLSSAALTLTVSSAAIIYYLAIAKFYATGVFWDGALAGIFGCVFLASLCLAELRVTGKDLFGKSYRLIILIFVGSGLVTAVLLLFKPGDSDVWWYGAIAGFLSCLSLVFLSAAALIILRLINLRWAAGKKLNQLLNS